MPVLDKDNVKKTIETFENQNGTKLKDFSVKEIVVMFHKETQNKIDSTNKKIDKHIIWFNKKIDKHIIWSNKELIKVYDVVKDHDILFEKIMVALPEKGFCENVTNALELNKKVTLSDKVELLWHDRRWIKAILASLIGLLGITGINIIIQVAT